MSNIKHLHIIAEERFILTDSNHKHWLFGGGIQDINKWTEQTYFEASTDSKVVSSCAGDTRFWITSDGKAYGNGRWNKLEIIYSNKYQQSSIIMA